jgi:pimeloyl-ACP methyl ester carboxylesterase
MSKSTARSLRRRSSSTILGAAVVAGVVLLAGGCGGSPRSALVQSGPSVKTDAGVARPYGHGSSAVWVLTPSGARARSVVVFIHGWTATSPFDWHQVWLDHLLRKGSAVVFPVYQTTGGDDEFVTAPYNLRDGLQAGFRALGQPQLPVVVVGYSVGGALAFYYAADALGWGVPRPAAAYSIFPIDPLAMDPGLLHLGTPPRIRFLIFVADKDDVVGDAGAVAFLKWLAPVPNSLKTRRLLHSDPNGLFFDHYAPTNVGNPGMRRVFWGSLDLLVARARLRKG